MLAKEHKLNFRTVSRYINITDVEESSIYDTSNQRSSYLDKYKSQILALYNKTRNISEVYRRLEDYIPNLKYSTLKYYMRKLEKNGYKNDRIKEVSSTKINRSQIIKYIFNWGFTKEIINDINKALEKYPALKTYKYFYQTYKEYLISLNLFGFLSLVDRDYKETCINKYISSLKKYWDAVINAAYINLSNGVTEGNVNRIKQIKRDMYGRASYELLRKKVIYQSSFS